MGSESKRSVEDCEKDGHIPDLCACGVSALVEEVNELRKKLADGAVTTAEEFRAMALVIHDHAKLRGEDIIGSFMLTGGFHVLRGNKLVALATKVSEEGPLTKDELQIPKDGLFKAIRR
jgi:hypothetical protein